jgi:hypothetical protein
VIAAGGQSRPKADFLHSCCVLPVNSVVTFTNKAANEMKVRLSKIIGAETVDKLVMGTFHSCLGFPTLLIATDRRLTKSRLLRRTASACDV